MKSPKPHFYNDVALISLIVCSWIIAVCSFFLPYHGYADIIITPQKKIYFHHEFIELTAQVKNQKLKKHLIKNGIPVMVMHEGRVVTGIGIKQTFVLRYRNEDQRWYCRWPCPWNTDQGWYKPVANVPACTYRSRPFMIKKRPIKGDKKPLAIMTYETNNRLSSIRPPTPAGYRGNWKTIFDWCDFTGTDTLWLLGGQTAYFTEPVREEFPWLEHNLDQFGKIGRYAHSRSINFCLYVMAYLTFGENRLKPKRYEYAIDYNPKNDTLFESRSISLGDTRRIADIVKILKQFSRIPSVDYIGIDYIRNALGGFELVDDFVHDMQVATPAGWKELSYEERMKWLAREKVSRKNLQLIDQWQWWRAHTVGSLVEQIKKSVGTTKPLWVFTLSWERGWQHGQDPVMMTAAGADIDAVMLYEADQTEFTELLKHWRSYLDRDDARIIVGDVIDWNLHQKTRIPAGPEEYLSRNTAASQKIYRNGPAYGIFLHDLQRLFWGRRGPYSRIEWALAGATAVSRLTSRMNPPAYTVTLSVPETVQINTDFSATLDFTNNTPSRASAPRVELYTSPGCLIFSYQPQQSLFEVSQSSDTLLARVIDYNPSRAGRHYIGVRMSWLEHNRKKSYSNCAYFTVTESSSTVGPFMAGMHGMERTVIRSIEQPSNKTDRQPVSTAGSDDVQLDTR
ncbi:MAG: hypothetical protein GF384_07810 [Elusimicrobia bacterium]|nr:hypothetical protein [Elusimicrobiota bacterium]MBD3412549.1 hypothetical protein [Elusimicrobiota bacterium]